MAQEREVMDTDTLYKFGMKSVQYGQNFYLKSPIVYDHISNTNIDEFVQRLIQNICRERELAYEGYAEGYADCLRKVLASTVILEDRPKDDVDMCSISIPNLLCVDDNVTVYRPSKESMWSPESSWYVEDIARAYDKALEEDHRIIVAESVFAPKSDDTIDFHSCMHDLKDYVGLTETYKYCTKCDHKE